MLLQRAAWLLALLVGLPVAAESPPRAALDRAALDLETLRSGDYPRSIDLAAYAPSARALPASQRIEGRLTLRGQPSILTLFADENYLEPGGLERARSLPPLDIEVVQDGDALIPAIRGPIPSTHGWWEWVIEPGRVWDEPEDQGFSRAVLPFALVQKNANCTHNGVLLVLFKGEQVLQRAALQISSETCQYLQLDMWGWLQVEYDAGPIQARDALIRDHRGEVAARLPTRSIADLADMATAQGAIDPARLAIGNAAARTRYGVLYRGVHYVSPCHTRHGDYPFCDVLDLPSFSLAKSMLAAVALMRMEQVVPGTALLPLRDLISDVGCQTEAWSKVRLIDLLDMASGHYQSPDYMADEDAAEVVRFFRPTSHADKLAFACRAYPYRQAAGQRWVYHTSDTYLLGTALNRLLHRKGGGDIVRDVVAADVFAPLQLSPTAHVSRRSDDSAAQPFFGWGLTLLADDIAKLAQFIGSERGHIKAQPVLDQALLDAALQRDPHRRGLPVAHLKSFRYQHGLWARDLQQTFGCAQPTWVPFMSGFGGLTVVLLPNGAVWYNIADDGELASMDFAAPARELSTLGELCAGD